MNDIEMPPSNGHNIDPPPATPPPPRPWFPMDVNIELDGQKVTVSLNADGTFTGDAEKFIAAVKHVHSIEPAMGIQLWLIANALRK